MNFMIKFVLLNLIIYHFKLLNLLRIEIDSSMYNSNMVYVLYSDEIYIFQK